MGGSQDSDDLERVWRALANVHRRRILDILSDHPQTTTDIAANFPDLTRFAVMQHLRVLEQGGLVVYRRSGRQRINYINPIPIQQIYQRWVKRYQEPWTEALLALKDTLEAGGIDGQGSTRSRRSKPTNKKRG